MQYIKHTFSPFSISFSTLVRSISACWVSCTSSGGGGRGQELQVLRVWEGRRGGKQPRGAWRGRPCWLLRSAPAASQPCLARPQPAQDVTGQYLRPPMHSKTKAWLRHSTDLLQLLALARKPLPFKLHLVVGLWRPLCRQRTGCLNKLCWEMSRDGVGALGLMKRLSIERVEGEGVA